MQRLGLWSKAPQCAQVGDALILRLALFLTVLSIGLTAGCGDDDPTPGPLAFATRCQTHEDCASLACVDTQGQKLCSQTCEDVLGDECPANWKCRRPSGYAGLACVCDDPRGCEVSPEAGVPSTCTRDSDCDDGIDCTANSCRAGACIARLLPNMCGAGESCRPSAGGCVPGAACTQDFECFDSDPCTTSEQCDLSVGRCSFQLRDDDGDGFVPVSCGGDDCEDLDPNISPLATERCDGFDNDCDQRIDEGDNLCPSGNSCDFGRCRCPFDLVDCGASDECVDMLRDPNHCGSCGNRCNVGFSCNGGFCEDRDECSEGVQCPANSDCFNVPGGVECRCLAGFAPDSTASACINVDECTLGIDSCDRTSQRCVDVHGSFMCVCAPGFTSDRFASGRCVDLDECMTGALSCGPNGTCRNLTGSATCDCNFGYFYDARAGACVVDDPCQAGMLEDFAWCAGGCRDLRTTEAHCGACNRACAPDALCEDSNCVCADSALSYCGNGCVNTASDSLHCGECNRRCPTSAGCVGGECFCPGGTALCGNACIALGTVLNCTACGDACASGASCGASGCACPAGSPTVCGNACVNTLTSSAHCGGCGMTCPPGASCAGGNCVCPGGSPNRCGNRCVDFGSDENACGDCSTSCDVICNLGGCETAEQIALGSGYGCVLFGDERLGCFGSNTSGRLGRSLSFALSSVELGLLQLEGIEEVAAGPLHACARDSSDVLRCWGENGSQQLGNGSTVDQGAPVTTRSGVAQVALGALHTCVVLQDGRTVQCIGTDLQGQRGDGDGSPPLGNWSGPSELRGVTKLVSGDNHLCALAGDTIRCWGDNSFGQLGNGTSGNTASAPVTVVGLSGVTDIAAGGNHTCAVVRGSVYCFGHNSSAQCGTSASNSQAFAAAVPGITTAVAVAAGGAHSCALLSNGRVQCWGSASSRQNGRTETGPSLTTLAGTYVAIAAGLEHSCGVTTDGDFLCWGDGPSLTLGIDTAVPTRIPR